MQSKSPGQRSDPADRWILVTGASTGIGQATLEYLATHGFHVYAGMRNTQDIEKWQHTHAHNVIPVRLDVTNPNDVENVLEFIRNRKTGLYGLVNNAGMARAGPLMAIEEKTFQEQFEVNVFGIHRVTKAMFPLLYASRGRIVMMSSDSGFFATPFFGPYCSSKFAVEGYADSLRREIGLYDMKVILIQPGRITTPIWDKGEQLLKQFDNPSSILAMELFGDLARKVGEYAIRKGRTEGLRPVEVAKVVYQALTVPKPKVRYLIAPHTLRYRLVKILPACKVDEMVIKELRELER
jgi:NAD(P)-dependent dehydrogenase (short-subunit alcohol dehydrogenase family)